LIAPDLCASKLTSRHLAFQIRNTGPKDTANIGNVLIRIYSHDDLCHRTCRGRSPRFCRIHPMVKSEGPSSKGNWSNDQLRLPDHLVAPPTGHSMDTFGLEDSRVSRTEGSICQYFTPLNAAPRDPEVMACSQRHLRICSLEIKAVSRACNII
jgi:hypothetical protein